MAFAKAVQKVNPEAHVEYVKALLEYKAECKAYYRAKKLWKNSPLPHERLKWYDAEERHSLACKAFHAAMERNARAHVLKHFEERQIDISGLTLAQVAAIDVPLSMHDMIEREKRLRAEQLIESDPEMQAYKKVALEYMGIETEREQKNYSPTSTKGRFLDSRDPKDVTADSLELPDTADPTKEF